MAQKYYNYETKCRRCSLLTNWHFSVVGVVPYSDFLVAIDDKIQYPRAKWCDTCNKQTLQEVVAYTTDSGGE